MINNEILKIRPVYEELKTRLVRDINEAYGRGVPFYLINSVIEGLTYQLKPLMDEEVYTEPPKAPKVEQVEVTEPPVEEKGEQE